MRVEILHNDFRSKTVLVTGANGFVGKTLCAELSRQGHSVRAAVRSANIQVENTETVSVGEISGETNWADVLTGIKVVVHLAARVHVMKDNAVDPLDAFRKVNVEGTRNLARQAAEAGVQRFIFISSIKVNGDGTSLGQPYTAEDQPAPADPYGISKREAEDALRQLADETGMEVVIIRPSLVYGPGVKANFLTMMRFLHKGVPLPFGAINNRRSLVALDNLVDFIIVCIKHPAAANQTFLISDGEDLSTSDLLVRLAGALNTPVRLLPVSQKLLEAGLKWIGKGDLAQRICGSLQVDITKARTMLDWKPLISVDEGLRRSAEYFLRARG